MVTLTNIWCNNNKPDLLSMYVEKLQIDHLLKAV
jgi:hypothetical protein